jgi:cytochrome c oxidase subunit 1
MRGPRSVDNPWGSKGYEWLSTSPPPKHNFHETPVITEPPHSYQKPGEQVEHVVI